MARPRGGAVPLFAVSGRPARRRPPACARFLRELRRLDVLEPVDTLEVAELRTLVEALDRDYVAGVSAYQLAYAIDKACTLQDRLAGEAVGAATFDDLRALLSAE